MTHSTLRMWANSQWNCNSESTVEGTKSVCCKTADRRWDARRLKRWQAQKFVRQLCFNMAFHAVEVMTWHMSRSLCLDRRNWIEGHSWTWHISGTQQPMQRGLIPNGISKENFGYDTSHNHTVKCSDHSLTLITKPETAEDNLQMCSTQLWSPIYAKNWDWQTVRWDPEISFLYREIWWSNGSLGNASPASPGFGACVCVCVQVDYTANFMKENSICNDFDKKNT